MKTSTLTSLAFAGLSSAEFWIARAVITQGEVVCPTPVTCTNPTTREDTYILRGDEREDCDVISDFGISNGPLDDPFCTSEDDTPKKFTLKGSNVCALSEETEFFFRVSSGTDNQLDVALDDSFDEIIATCPQELTCDEQGDGETSKVCDNITTQLIYRCDATNGSDC